MLNITVPAIELYDEQKDEFIYLKEQKLQLEHSLVSLSKWESKWHKAFLTKAEKTEEEMRDYIRCMTITQNVDPEVYKYLSHDNIAEIRKYIDNPMTATYVSEDTSAKGGRETVTSELIYYWMISLNIPDRFEKWHLNRLMTLIKVCNRKNSPKKRRSKKDIASEYASLNAARKKQLNTRG